MDIKRIITGLLLALLIIVLFLNIPAGHPIALLILLAICGLALWEFYTLLIAGGLASSRKWGTAIGIIFCIATWLYMLNPIPSNHSILPSDTLLWSIMLLVVISTFYRLLGYTDMRDGLNHGLGTLLGFIYVPFLFSFFIRLFFIDDISQPAWIAFYTVLTTKISDTGGYFIGSRFGRNKLATTISPKKAGKVSPEASSSVSSQTSFGSSSVMDISEACALVSCMLSSSPSSSLSLAPQVIWLNRF